MTYTPDIRYFMERSTRRGTATYNELLEMGSQYDACFVDRLAEQLNSAGVRLVDEKETMITPQTNVLMNSLRVVELISLALRLPVVPKIPRRLHEEVLRQRSYELDLRRLEYLDVDQEWYYLSPGFNRLQRAIRRLFDSEQIPFANEWRRRQEDLAYLRGLVGHPSFAQRIRPKIRKHYLGIRAVRLLVRWIEATGKRAPAMVDIVHAGLDEHGFKVVRSVLFSNRASTSNSALKSQRDVCFSCPPEKKCVPLKGVDDPYDVLVRYRHADLDALLATKHIAPNEFLLEDHLVVKFFVPHSIVVSSKTFMTEICCLDDSVPIRYKNTGKYCPHRDKWPLAQSART